MADWGDSRSQTGSRIAPSSRFSCGFNILGRYIRRAGSGPVRAPDLLSSESELKKPWYPQTGPSI